MDWSWISSDGSRTKFAQDGSDLEVRLIEPRFDKYSYVVSRQTNGCTKSNDDMYIEAFAQISAKWMLIGDNILQSHNGDPLYYEAIARIELSLPSNQRGNFSFFPCIRIPQDRGLPRPPQEIVGAYRTWDVKYWRKVYGITFYAFEWASIWKEVRVNGEPVYGSLSWDNYGYLNSQDKDGRNNPPTLKMLCMRKLSWTNLAFTGDEDGTFTVHAVSNLYPKKLPQMVDRFDKPTRYITQNMKSLEHLIPGALDMLYYAMGTREHFSTHVWDYETEKERAVHTVRVDTASGLRNGPRLEQKMEGGVRIVASATGKKMEQMPYAIGELERTRKILLDNPKYVPQDAAAQISLKDEAFNKYQLPREEAERLEYKLRPFYILSLFQLLMAFMVNKFRQTVERGRVIKIGINFWFGGATAFAMSIGADDPEIIFEDGDFKHLDATIHMILLMLYVTQAAVYFAWNGMTEQNVLLLRAFLRICSERLSIKVTHIFSTIWRVIYGGMPSGAFETSHGDSWIVAFLYFLYIRQVMERHPDRVAQIRELFRLFRCGIVVYGDDHVLYTHRDLNDIINEAGFARFVAEFWGMSIRDMHRADFFTHPSPYSGQIEVYGIVFLKRYFVLRDAVFTKNEILTHDISPILPYRPLGALVMKLAYGKAEEKSIVEYIVSSIGMAYDTQGTNKMAYNFCKHVFQELSLHVDGNIKQVLVDFMHKIMEEGKDAYITRLMRTAAITENDIVRGFPSWLDLISRHRYRSDIADLSKQKLAPEYESFADY